MAMPRNRPAPKETEPIRAHKNQNTIEGKQKAGGWGRFAPQPPALIDKVSRMSRNEVSRMSWNLTLKRAPPMRPSAMEMGKLRGQASRRLLACLSRIDSLPRVA